MHAAAWDAFVKEFLASTFEAHPDLAVVAGRHEFDGRLPDWSAAALEGEAARLRSQRERALSFKAAALDERRRFEREYLLATAEGALFWLESARWPFRSPRFYAEALDPNVYLTREYAPLAKRMRAYVRYAEAVPEAARQIRANLAGPLPRTYVEVGRTTFGGLAEYYETEPPLIFSAVEDPHLQARFRTANESAGRAMRGLDHWLEEREEDAAESFALGSALFSEMLRATEGIDLGLDRLEEVGREDLERNLDALHEACAALAPEMSVRECVARVQARKPPEGPIEEARRQLAGLKRFTLDQDLVAIPGDEQADVRESPPYMRWNFAYIDIPGPYDSDLPAVYYIASPDPSWQESERLAYLPGEADLLFTSVHEVWPGHFLQFLHSNRSPSELGRVFVGYGFAEGWAHYVEELVWEAGLRDGDPETHIGQLLNALVRNVRYLSAIGLHAGGMTVEESERMFREQAFQDPVTARQQAARGTFDPGYLNYTLGKLVIRKLRDDWTATRGGREAWREFHDRLLSYGGPPLPLVRAAMLETDATSLL